MEENQYFALAEASKGSISEIEEARAGPFAIWGKSSLATSSSIMVEGVIWGRLHRLSTEAVFDSAAAFRIICQLTELAQADGYSARSAFEDMTSSRGDEIEDYDWDMFLHRSESELENLDPRPSTFIQPNGYLNSLIASYAVLDQQMSPDARSFFDSLPINMEVNHFQELERVSPAAMSWQRPVLNLLMSAYLVGVAEAKADRANGRISTPAPKP